MRCARVSHAGAAGGTAVRRSGSCLPVLPNGGDASLHFPIPWGDRLGIQTYVSHVAPCVIAHVGDTQRVFVPLNAKQVTSWPLVNLATVPNFIAYLRISQRIFFRRQKTNFTSCSQS